ncbi:MAG TPA: zf-HC2 domain-containing protein [Streptosporangiaceae bacterium]|nr:zf-HC2 domain-containing protein [Streptosporangiaceae bacterium]
MTESWDCAEAKISLGVYVLGAIDPAERALVDAHVATCRDCRDELAGLAGIPALLARVNPEEVERIAAEQPEQPYTEAPPELIGTVVSLAAARRRRSRWRYLASAAAVVAVVAGVFGGLAASGGPASGPPAIAFPPGNTNWELVSGTSKSGDVNATVSYGIERWGTVLAAKVEGIPVGTTCQLYVVHNDGTRTMATEWTTASDEGTVWYWGAMAMPGTDKGIASFQVTEGPKLLVTVPAT